MNVKISRFGWGKCPGEPNIRYVRAGLKRSKIEIFISEIEAQLLGQWIGNTGTGDPSEIRLSGARSRASGARKRASINRAVESTKIISRKAEARHEIGLERPERVRYDPIEVQVTVQQANQKVETSGGVGLCAA